MKKIGFSLLVAYTAMFAADTDLIAKAVGKLIDKVKNNETQIDLIIKNQKESSEKLKNLENRLSGRGDFNKTLSIKNNEEIKNIYNRLALLESRIDSLSNCKEDCPKYNKEEIEKYKKKINSQVKALEKIEKLLKEER